MKTRNGVCYDLTLSDFIYESEGVQYVFSSQLHLDKFKAKKKENRDIINYSLSRRFNLPVNVNHLADMVLYRKIETRGFLVFSEGTRLCQEDITYIGGRVTNKD